MRYVQQLETGILLKRYKRFFADIQFQDKQITAHVPNTGSLKSCLFEGQKCYFSHSSNPERKLKYTLESLETPTGLVGVNTQMPNQLVKKALENKFLKQWKNFDIIKPEFKISPETRIDFRVEDSNSKKVHYIEVKNVSLKEKGVALFPDAVTARGQKHLNELMKLQKEGNTCEIIFVIQRDDVKSFQAAKEIDSDYANLLKQSHDLGVLITPLVCHLNDQEIFLTNEILPVEF
ncbi:MAG: DNA/RNA nuclease SfsA [Deltaproteobacteria bacterium]|nr:DNA/RNA nuclease SfsA [Deltaproteobacteria bacterium]